METYNYDFLNLYNAYREPSTVHCSDSYMVRYFTRYLFQKAISVFDWQGMPEHWSKDFFLYVLYARGYLAITDVPGYGPIPQNCSLMGRAISSTSRRKSSSRTPRSRDSRSRARSTRTVCC